MTYAQKKALAYVIGIALGDGNLSNPNGRAIRLRITCDAKYPSLAQEIIRNLHIVFPNNKVGIIRPTKTKTFFNISIYSNTLSKVMPWQAGKGSKFSQNARVPLWIRRNKTFSKICLKALLQTDGCMYVDRGYKMVNFTNHTKALTHDVYDMLINAGFIPTFSTTQVKTGSKYTVRVAKQAERLVSHLSLYKA